MKRVTLLILLLVTANIALAQYECTIIDGNQKTSGNIPNSNNFIPSSSTPIKYIRVNIHFMLRSQGHIDYPGHFTKNGDGYGNPNFTGYDYAEMMVNTANSRLSSNHQMNLPPNNSTSVLPRKYRYVLNGVFFHEDNNYYYFPNNPQSLYGENKGQSINVFLSNANGNNGGGIANLSGNRFLLISGTWERYQDDIITGRGIESGLWVAAHTLNHEVGHNLSLLHTMRYNHGPCNNNQEDYCTDTPTRQAMINNFGFDPCCGWGGGSNCSNNLMDYSGADAITPEQLGRMHWTIENEIEEYKTCYFINPTQSITSFSDNKSYIAENVNISSNSTITVNNNNAMFINAEEFEVSGEFEIDDGSILIVNTLPKCN